MPAVLSSPSLAASSRNKSSPGLKCKCRSLDAVIVEAFPTDGDGTQCLNILTDILSQGKEKWGGPFVTLYNLIAAQLDWPTEVVIQQAAPVLDAKLERLVAGARTVNLTGNSRDGSALGTVQQSQVTFKASSGRACQSLGDLSDFETVLDGLLYTAFVENAVRFQPTLAHISGVPISQIMRQRSFTLAAVIFHGEIFPGRSQATHAAVTTFTDIVSTMQSDAVTVQQQLDAAGSAAQLVKATGLTINQVIMDGILTAVKLQPDLLLAATTAIDADADVSAQKVIAVIRDASVRRGMSLSKVHPINCTGDRSREGPVAGGTGPPHTMVKPCPRCKAIQHPDAAGVGHYGGKMCWTNKMYGHDGKRDPRGADLPKETIGKNVKITDLPFWLRSNEYYSNVPGFEKKADIKVVVQPKNAEKESHASDYMSKYFVVKTTEASEVASVEDGVVGDTYEACERRLRDAAPVGTHTLSGTVDRIRGRHQLLGIFARMQNRKQLADIRKLDLTAAESSAATSTTAIMPLRLHETDEEPTWDSAATSLTVASVSTRFDFRKAAADLTKSIPSGGGKHKTNEHEVRKVRDASINAFDVDMVQVKLALSRAADGLKSSTTEANSVVDFESAMEMVENVLDRLPCEYDQWRSKVMAAHARGQVEPVPEVATDSAFDAVVDSGAAGSIFPHLPNKNEKDRLICEAMNKSTSTTTGSSAVDFKVKDVNGHLRSIQLRRAHELKESSMAIISLFDLRQEGCQFHMNDDDMWIQDAQGHRIPCRFKDKIVCLRLVSGLSPAK